MKPLFSNLLSEGGPLFMYLLLILLIACVALVIKAFVKGDPEGKTRKLVGSISLFALVWGFLGHLIGLIGAMDAISTANDISNGVLAAGLKVALLSPTFGMVVFLIARAGMIGLQLKKN
jgi:hypothetical protein